MKSGVAAFAGDVRLPPCQFERHSCSHRSLPPVLRRSIGRVMSSRSRAEGESWREIE